MLRNPFTVDPRINKVRNLFEGTGHYRPIVLHEGTPTCRPPLRTFGSRKKREEVLLTLDMVLSTYTWSTKRKTGEGVFENTVAAYKENLFTEMLL